MRFESHLYPFCGILFLPMLDAGVKGWRSIRPSINCVSSRYRNHLLAFKDYHFSNIRCAFVLQTTVFPLSFCFFLLLFKHPMVIHKCLIQFKFHFNCCNFCCVCSFICFDPSPPYVGNGCRKHTYHCFSNCYFTFVDFFQTANMRRNDVPSGKKLKVIEYFFLSLFCVALLLWFSFHFWAFICDSFAVACSSVILNRYIRERYNANYETENSFISMLEHSTKLFSDGY